MSGPIGKFVWCEYMGDRNAAAGFYAPVVGWSVKDAGMGDFPYDIVSAGDYPVGGIMDIPAEARAMGARPAWMSYVWVEDVDAAAKRLASAGGRIHKDPADIPGVGRFAVVADPYAAAFMLFRDANGNPPSPPPPGTPGLVGWRELHAGDGVKALAFYTDFFGWKKDADFDMGPMGIYHIFNTGHGEQGGIMTRRPETPHSFWLYYFDVEALDPAIERAKAHGGRMANGPVESRRRTMDRAGARPAGGDVRPRRAEAIRRQKTPRGEARRVFVIPDGRQSDRSGIQTRRLSALDSRSDLPPDRSPGAARMTPASDGSPRSQDLA